MSKTLALAERIYSLAEKIDRKPSTLSRELLGSGVRLAQIAEGSTMTMDTYSRVEREVSKREREAA